MKQRIKRYVMRALLAVCPLALTAPAIGGIVYDAQDLGAGVWQVDYQITGVNFAAGEGFQLFFDYGLYDNISLTSSHSDWDVITWNPEVILGVEEDGVLDALALVDFPSLAEVFSVQFTWLGQGAPGAQDFDIYNIDFEVIGGGTAEPRPVPTPATLTLFGIGLLGYAGLRRRAV